MVATSWYRFSHKLTGNRVRIDIKFIDPIGPTARQDTGKSPITRELPNPATPRGVLLFPAIDDCTRLHVQQIYPRCDQKTAVQVLGYVLQRSPFRVAVIQSDNGAEFQT